MNRDLVDQSREGQSPRQRCARKQLKSEGTEPEADMWAVTVL